MLRLLREEGLMLQAHYQRERRKLAEGRKVAVRGRADWCGPGVAVGLSESETTGGGTWRIAGYQVLERS